MIAFTGCWSSRSTLATSTCSLRWNTPASAPWAMSRRISSSEIPVSGRRCAPMSRRIRPDEVLNSQTSGRPMRARERIGRATSVAARSGWSRPSCLGTSSPTTTDTQVRPMTTTARASRSACGASTGTVLSHRPSGSTRAVSPMAPLRMPTMVMPIWMVERKTVGLRFRPSAEPAPGRPWSARARSRASRAESTAISDRANTPLIRMSRGSRSSSMRVSSSVAGAVPASGYSSACSGVSPREAARSMIPLHRSANTKWWKGSTAYQ